VDLGGVVVAMERFVMPTFIRFSGAPGPDRVVEPELDMERRQNRRRNPTLDLVRSLVLWLMPATRTTAPPMRSIDRELSEGSNDYF
jgi:hypothetical protein